MPTSCCCFIWLKQNEQVKLKSPASRHLISGPAYCGLFDCLFSTVENVNMRHLQVNQQTIIMNEDDLTKSRFVFGPGLVKLESPWEYFHASGIQQCTVLDQDDYLVVRDAEGFKRTERGPKVFKPRWGDGGATRCWTINSNTYQSLYYHGGCE